MDTNEIPPKYLSDSLFLLIGTNPLPNYVAARLLLEPGGTAYLFHSSSTVQAAERLARLLNRESIKTVRKEISAGNPDSVYYGVRSIAAAAIGAGRVGLNYTGGTKAMAVHAYRALEEMADCAGRPAIFSYLDATDLGMVIDPIETEHVQRFSIGLSLDMPLDDLLALHAIKLTKKATTNVVLPESASALARVHSTKEGIKKWRAWCCRELRRKASKDGKSSEWKSTTALKAVELKWPTDPDLHGAVEAIQKELGLGTGPTFAVKDTLQSGSFSKPAHFCAWLDGTWLEHYTLDQIYSVRKACRLGDVAINLTHQSSGKHFEFDVAAMRGYQLFAISCTTSICLSKSKWFEAYVRARQLGGDEARTGLICGHSDPDRLRQQIEEDWDAEGKFRVFGPSHLPELAKHLTEWFEST